MGIKRHMPEIGGRINSTKKQKNLFFSLNGETKRIKQKQKQKNGKK